PCVGGHGIEIICRRETPTSSPIKEKGVIAEMIVTVGDHHIEDHAAPELWKIELRSGTVLAERVRDLHAAPCLAFGFAQHAERGQERDARAPTPVEAAQQEHF